MQSLTSIVIAGTLAIQAVFSMPDLSSAERDAQVLKRSVDSFISTETPIALANILCNIGSDGACATGAGSGIVVASPDKTNPDYFYTWTRDSALTLKCLIDIFINKYDPSLQMEIENYISAQAHLQTVSNPSGDFSDGSGLGEPKFHADGSAFTGSWGRPQRDGPALRATALITYSKWLINNGYNATARDVIWPIIKNDLAYVAQYWNETGFDLWEEVQGSSFFTVAAQYRSLIEGSAMASLFGMQCPDCDSQAPQLLCFLQDFRAPSNQFLLANINENNGRSRKDANTILGVIHQFDPSGVCDDSLLFSPCSDLALANHKAVTDAFRSLYSINSGIMEGNPVSVGRYQEDVYFDGNPWYLTTLAAAEQLYDALYLWRKLGSINITQVSLAFFKDFEPSITIGSFLASTSTYRILFGAILAYADGYMNIVASYVQTNGSLSEQFDKDTGAPLSAYDLTWSYAAFLTASARRAGIVSYSWSEGKYASLPPQCSAHPEAGSYVPARTPTWPSNQTPSGYTGTPTSATASIPSSSQTTTSTSCTCSPTSMVSVSFKETKLTRYGDTLKIVGSVPQLGDWEAARAVALTADQYTSTHPIWEGTVSLPLANSIEYKYINVGADGTVTWEADPNHTLSLANSCQTALTVSDRWQDALIDTSSIPKSHSH